MNSTICSTRQREHYDSSRRTTNPDALLEQAASEMRNMDVGVLVVWTTPISGSITDRTSSSASLTSMAAHRDKVVKSKDDKIILEDLGETAASITGASPK